MRKILVMLLMFLTLSVTAQATKYVLETLKTEIVEQNEQWYQTTEFAYKLEGQDWSRWYDSKITIKFIMNQDKIIIYSDDPQIYRVIATMDPPYDPSGQQVKFKVIDQDGDYGYLRLRVENSGNSQIYIDFSDISWVYNVIRMR